MCVGKKYSNTLVTLNSVMLCQREICLETFKFQRTFQSPTEVVTRVIAFHVTPSTVSYTHLDVYKRQTQERYHKK